MFRHPSDAVSGTGSASCCFASCKETRCKSAAGAEDSYWRERRCFTAEAGCPVVVAIPARDEAERIGARLTALAHQAATSAATALQSFGIVLVLNGCSDESFDIACGMAQADHGGVENLAAIKRRKAIAESYRRRQIPRRN